MGTRQCTPTHSKTHTVILSRDKYNDNLRPSYSPDLSLIENVWKFIKDDVYDGPKAKSMNYVWKKVQKWYDNKRTVFYKMQKKLTKRYLDVLEKKGCN